MTNEEERCWKYLVANRQATVEDVVLNCDVSLGFAEELMSRISSPNWREPLKQSAREDILNTATRLTCGDRNKAYGPPYDNLSDCAALWEAYLNTKWGCLVPKDVGYAVRITAEDVAWLMSLVKMARSFQTGYHRDNYVDAAAYAAIAGECREIQEAERV
jgi:hypothetical protein